MERPTIAASSGTVIKTKCIDHYSLFGFPPCLIQKQYGVAFSEWIIAAVARPEMDLSLRLEQ